MTRIFKILFFDLLCLIPIFPSPAAVGQLADTSASSSPPVRVSQQAASALILQKSPLKYPDAARAAGIEGTVVLRIDVSDTGAVKDVAIISGDPVLGQASVDSVKQWKYKPYVVNGVPVEMETELSITFRIKPGQPPPPSLGTFKDESYSNESLDIQYPLSRDWVRETEIMRKKAAAGAPGTYVLLEADSSFVLSALDGGSGSTESCDKYLQALGAGIQSTKQGKQKGEVSKFTI